MITSTKNYTKKKKNKNKKGTDRTLREMVKVKLYRQKSHKEVYTYTLTKREKGKNIYIVVPKAHRLNFGMSHCPFRSSTEAGYIKLIVEI